MFRKIPVCVWTRYKATPETAFQCCFRDSPISFKHKSNNANMSKLYPLVSFCDQNVRESLNVSYLVHYVDFSQVYSECSTVCST